LPFYGIVKSIPHKEAGIGLMFLYILSPLALPWLDKSGSGPEARIRPIINSIYIGILCEFLLLGWVGLMPVNSLYSTFGMWLTVSHFVLLGLLNIFSRHRYR
jgi:quinol-cytochrome oxidoreductase complex cytochrome b subunit